MNDPNVTCLFHCASAITGYDINAIQQFKDLVLYYKIIGISADNCSLNDLIKIISDFFNDKLPNVLDDNEDDKLLKILLLVIVIYILKSNESNKNSILMDLCEKIPLDLHSNACAMFAPIIIRYSDGDEVTDADLDKCLKDCDKENQMMFFSPIKTNNRSMLPDQRTFATQKQKIHQSLKACRNYEQFTTFDDFSQSESEESSSFVKLVNYVQSPDYQTSKLLKCNRDLGKSVNELEYKLYMSSNFEVELDKTITRWKEKCKSLENKLKQANKALHTKDEEIADKNVQIEQFSNLGAINKRLEEKMKDYQDKVSEMQIVNSQLESMIEENKKLTTENHNLNHYYSLAKQRRIELETLTKELEYQKQLCSELNKTRELLSKTEAQLAEYQSCLHNVVGNCSHDSLSDASFNNSFYNPEPMSHVIEKERDELIGELSRLKETSVDKILHETTVNELHGQLTTAKEQLVLVMNLESDAIMFCQHMEEDNIWEGPMSKLIVEIKRLCEKYMSEKEELSIQLVDLSLNCESKQRMVSSLNEEVAVTNKKLDKFETESRCLFKSIVGNAEFKVDNFSVIIKDKFTYGEYRIKSLYDTLLLIKENARYLKDEIQQMKENTVVTIGEVVREIILFKECAAEGNVDVTFSHPWLESLYKYYQDHVTTSKCYDKLSKQFEQTMFDLISMQQTNEFLTLTNECLETKYQQTVTKYEEQLTNLDNNLNLKFHADHENLKLRLANEFAEMKRLLEEKHVSEELEMKCDMEKLIKDYQACLEQLNKLGLEYEDSVSVKDNLLAAEVRKVSLGNQRIGELEDELLLLNEAVKEVREKGLSAEGRFLEECKEKEIAMQELVDRVEVLTCEQTVMKSQLAEAKCLYASLETVTQQMKSEIDEERLVFDERVQTLNADLHRMSSVLREKNGTVEQLLTDNSNLENDLEILQKKASSNLTEFMNKEEKVVSLEHDLENAIRSHESDKFKVSKTNLENEKLISEIENRTLELEQMKMEKEMEIAVVRAEVSTLTKYLKSTQILLTETENKMLLEGTKCCVKDKKIEDLQSCVESCGSQISSISALLMTKNEEISIQQKELDQKTARVTCLEQEHNADRVQLAEMNTLIEDLEEASRIKSDRLSDMLLEISGYKQSIDELGIRNVNLQSQINELMKDMQSKDMDITVAKASINDYSDKIHNLECTIEEELRNYEKMNVVYKHAEEESICYVKRYNDLAKESLEESTANKRTINELTGKIHRIEEERDDQIHEMEKEFNVKIFELEQIVEESTLEIQTMKEESIASRKTFKLIRLQLEGEMDRLQKALQSRETQFRDEKSSLKVSIDREREEKVKYKEGCEREIDRLQNQIKCNEEKTTLELNESKSAVTVLEVKVNEVQITNFRLTEELKERKSRYKNDIHTLETRVRELEPLEGKLKHLEDVSHRLMTKLTKLEESDTVTELQQLRQKNKSITDYVESLEQNEKHLAAEKVNLEQQLRILRSDYDDLLKTNNDLKESMVTVNDKLRGVEFRCQGRLATIENYERDMRALAVDNEALKKRYLMLRELNEKHKIEVERDHQAAVTNYIARIESLNTDLASFQQQIHFITEEKNTLVEKNYCSKRTIDEQAAKLEGLQKLIWNHTENERRQMLTTYDENSRFTRMSHWNDQPQLIRQLPPVSIFDRQIMDSMGLNATSRLRLESYVCSPYTMEDEASLSITKELPLPPLPPRNPASNISDSLSQLSVPIKKKKKDGIRIQLTNKIRRSLNLEPETPKSRKRLESDAIPVTPVKSEMSGTSSKPPIPKKNLFSAFKSNRKSSQMTVIDIEELRRKEGKRKSVIPKRENEDSQFTYVTPVSRNVRGSIAPASSVYSLFSQDSDDQSGSERKKQPPESRTSETDIHNFTQSAKTPKPNFVLRSLIRRSKNMSPKRKHTSTDSL